MVGSAGAVDRSTRRARTVVVVAVVGLLAAVVLSGADIVWMVVAGVAAVASFVAIRSVGRPADLSANSATVVPAMQLASSTVAPLDEGHDGDAVSRFVVSLARRNGGLVDQQLALLDTLEASVEDPALLANYFKLDHLATRMRRNADSLLVLAGVDRPGVRMPQDIDEVVRAGISEVEEYRRIDVLALEHVQVTGLAATTLGHLVAELLDNATAFSPPESRVRVAGNAVWTGYEILVADSGIGIADSRLDDLNRRLALAPEFGAVSDDSIGLTVVAKLAARIGATVTLSTSEHGGAVATVHIPSAVLHTSEPTEHVTTSPRATEPALAAVGAPPAAPTAPAANLSTEQLRVASGAAIAKLTLTVAGLPIRSTAATDDALPSRDGGSMQWPPPDRLARTDDGFPPPAPVRTALGPLQVAEPNVPRPVVEAQPARIGAALASFARQSAMPAWEPVTDGSTV